MLFFNDLDSIIFSRQEMFDCDELVIISGYVGPAPIKRLPSTGLKSTVIYGMYPTDGISKQLKNVLVAEDEANSNLDILCSGIPVHSKCYLWRNHGEVVHALVGSANFSENGLTTPYKEVLAETTKDTFRPLNEYYRKVLEQAIPCSEATTKAFRPSTEAAGTDIFTNPNICPMTMLIKENGRMIVPRGSGINWGMAEGSHVAPNDAYIPISAEMVRRYQNLFPVKQSAPTSWEGVVRKDHRDNDCIDIIWDDGTTMTGLLEGSRNVAGLEGKYPKQISSSPSKSEMGKYLRNRLGLPEGSVVKMSDFERYGRSSIDVSLLGEGVYYFDFSVRNDNGTTNT